MNKRNKKISKVMREYKAGTLKSGGSGKKVTNPKQAMAIALSEARNMNQGGMLNTIYQRPMFQTPQTRQGSGIMAGVAPVRGFEDGGLVAEDFFSMEQTEPGSGLNARDITNIIFDPEDPLDYATMSLLAFPPAYAIAKLANAGIKGSKLANQMRKFETYKEATGQGAKAAGAFEGVRLAGEVPRIFADEEPQYSDEVMEVASSIGNLRQKPGADAIRARVAQSYGDEFADQVMSAGNFANGGIATMIPKFSFGSGVGGVLIDSIIFLKKSGGPWIEKTLDALKQGRIDLEDARDLDVPEDAIQSVVGSKLDVGDMGGVVSPGNVRRAGDDIPEFEDDVLRSAEESFGVGGRSPFDDIPDADIGDVGRSADDLGPREIPMRDPGIPLDPSGNVIPMASSAERAAAASAGGARAARGGIETLAESPTKTPLLTKNRIAAAGGVAGLGVLLSNLSEDEEEVVTDPAVTSASVDTGGTGGDGDPPPPPPDPSVFSRIGDYLADPRTQASLMKVAKPTAGFTKRNPFVDFYEGGREYDVEQAAIRKGEEAGKTAMMKNLELIKKLQPEMKDEEVLSLLLGEKKKTKEYYMTLFIKEDIDSGRGVPTPERMKELEPMAALLSGQAAAGEAAKDADGNEIIL
jgi:hypothetical protein